MDRFAEFLALDARRKAGGELPEAEESRYQQLRAELSVAREVEGAALPRVWADAFPEAARALGEVALRAPASLEAFLDEGRHAAVAAAEEAERAAAPTPVPEPVA